MSTYQWLIGFHVLAAFLFIGGSVLVGILHFAAICRERPSEVAALLRLTRIGVLAVALGALLVLGVGVWLAEEINSDFGALWLQAAFVLWGVSLVLGGLGGRSARHTRYLAERLAGEGDHPDLELKRALVSPVALAANYSSLAAALAALALMIWKPV